MPPKPDPPPQHLRLSSNVKGASPEHPYHFLNISVPPPRHLHHAVNLKAPSPEHPYHFLNIGGPLPEGSYHFLTIEDLLNMISIRVFGHSVFPISKNVGLGSFWACGFYRAWEDPPEVEQPNEPRTSGSLHMRAVERPSWYIRNGKRACLGE